MNRRKLFGFLAATPFAAAAVREAVAAPIVSEPVTPFGYMRIVHESYPSFAVGPVTDPGHTHSFSLPSHQHTCSASLISTAVSVPHQEIYDGQKFVRLNSPEGAAVFNKLMART